jgi:hypothetical protein
LPSYLPSHLPSHSASYLTGYLADYLAGYLASYLPGYLPSYLPSYLPGNLSSHLPSYLPNYLPSYLASCLPSYLSRSLPSPLNDRGGFADAGSCLFCWSASEGCPLRRGQPVGRRPCGPFGQDNLAAGALVLSTQGTEVGAIGHAASLRILPAQSYTADPGFWFPSASRVTSLQAVSRFTTLTLECPGRPCLISSTVFAELGKG